MHDFTDLRIDHVSKGDDSFWPSFTDIMTVIVMIFLIATSMLILQNWKLIEELTSTLQAKEEVQALAQSTSQENQTLEEQLSQAERQLSMMRLAMMQSEQEKQELLQQREKHRKALAKLAQEHEQQTEKLNLLQQQFNEKLALLESKNRQYDQLQQQYQQSQSMNQQLQQVMLEKETLLKQKQTQITEKEQQIAALSRVKTLSEATISQLKEDFSSLKVKYDKLIRPARSPRGKFVVELRYTKKNKKYIAELKLPQDKVFKRYNDVKLHRTLASLKKKYSGNLYIKIIFPENSGLSYNEAWKFTNGILKRYDYYYDEESLEKSKKP